MLSDDAVLSIVRSELGKVYNGSTDTGGGSGIPNLGLSLDYYMGNPNGHEVEGRSRVTSTDVADAIEWIMPQLMKSFTQNNDIVTFDPVSEGDEKQADMESQYVYEVLMKQNDGFILLHQFIKDALMQRNGILKVYFEERTTVWSSDYTGISEQELAVLTQMGGEVIELTGYQDEQSMIAYEQHTQQNPGAQVPPPPTLYNVKVEYNSDEGQIVIDPVPPEEFRVNQDHNSINLDSARFTAHIVDMTKSELVALGYDKDMVKELPTGGSNVYETEYRFHAQGEDVYTDNDSVDWTQEEVTVAECFLLIDVDEDGVSELCKVMVVGGDSPTNVLDITPIEGMPWISTTAILMSHKWQGLSIFDRLKEIQDQKTALWRSMFDNIYLQNNQRFTALEGAVNMDDLLVSRPNGIVRVKRQDALVPIITPQLTSDNFSMMSYLDQVKAGRSGVSAEGGATPQNIGDRVGSQGVDRMMNAKEELVGLIVRVVAETGVKPLCIKIRDLSIKHVSTIKDFKFRGEWSKVQPSSWMSRSSTTVRVGTGSGNTSEKVSALTQIMMIQEKLAMMPGQNLIEDEHFYSAIDDYCKWNGLNGAGKYFLDPNTEFAQQKRQQGEKQQAEDKQKMEQMQQAVAKSQIDLAQAEMMKAKAQSDNVQLKAQIDTSKNELKYMEQKHDAQVATLNQQLDRVKMVTDSIEQNDELKFKYDQLDVLESIELKKIGAKEDTRDDEQ